AQPLLLSTFRRFFWLFSAPHSMNSPSASRTWDWWSCATSPSNFPPSCAKPTQTGSRIARPDRSGWLQFQPQLPPALIVLAIVRSRVNPSAVFPLTYMARNTGVSWLKWLIILLLLGGAAYGGWRWYGKREKEGTVDY